MNALDNIAVVSQDARRGLVGMGGIHAVASVIREHGKKEIWSTFWGDYFTLMWVDQKHCLEYVLQKGLACIHRRDFASAATLLAPFPPLRSLLFIHH